MGIKRIENPGEMRATPQALPMFCYAGWASWVNPEELLKSADAQARQRFLASMADVLEQQAELMKAAARAVDKK